MAAKEALARLRSVKGLLFDLDGTLVDLPIDYDRLRSRLRAHFIDAGIADPPQFKPMLTTIDRLTDELRHMGHAENDVLRAFETAQRIVDEEENAGCQGATALPGAKDLLGWLRTKRIPWSVVSRNKVFGITLAMGATGLPYRQAVVIVGREMVKAPKPSALHAMPALKAMGLEGWAVAMVGDSWHDIELGHNIGAVSVRVWERELAKPVIPDLHFKTLAKLSDALRDNL